MDPEKKFETSSYLCYKISYLTPIILKISLLGLSLPYFPHPPAFEGPDVCRRSPEPEKNRVTRIFPSNFIQRHRPPRQAPAKSMQNPRQTFEMDPFQCLVPNLSQVKYVGDT